MNVKIGALAISMLILTVAVPAVSAGQGSQAENILPPAAAVLIENIAALGQNLPQNLQIGRNSVASVTVQSANAVVVNFEAAQPVATISVTTNIAMETISVQVQELPQKPAPVPEPAIAVPGVMVYRYIEITATPTAAAPVQMENATIEFKVPKAWLLANNIDPATVKLLRYAGQWVELPTTATGAEDANYKYYSATTPGFSTFAMTGKVMLSMPWLIVIVGAILAALVSIGAVRYTVLRKG